MNSRMRYVLIALLAILLMSAVHAQDGAGRLIVMPSTTRDAPETGLPNTYIRDGGFELNGVWREESGIFSFINCSVADCGASAFAGPRTDSRYIWFGGSSAAQKQFIQQSLYIPNTTSVYLGFYYWVGAYVPATNPKFVVKIDGNTIFNAGINATTAGYQYVALDLSGYADGGLHKLRFQFKQNAGGVTTVSLDDVELQNGYHLPVSNTGFEFGTTDWTISNGSGDNGICNTLSKTYSYSGSCAFSFKGSANENSSLTQEFGILRSVPEVAFRAPPFYRTYLGAFVQAGPGATGTMKVALTFSDLTTKKATVSLAGTGEYIWKQTAAKRYSSALEITFVKITFRNTSASGKIYIDDIELVESADYN